MAARKSAPKAEASTPQDASAEGPTPEPAPEPTPEPAPKPELPPAVAPAPPEPVHTYKAPRPEPKRAGGHVLTERGWELDTGQEA